VVGASLGVLSLAAAAAALILARSRAPSTAGYVAEKGTPAAQILVRRDGATTVWDGHRPVRPGDALAVRVACEGLARIALAAPGGANGDWTRLADVGCSANPSEPLPLTLVVDDQPGDERLAVVVSRAPLDDDRLRDAARTKLRTADVWTVRFDLPKEGAPR
jgi:hypothetical protein